jgi:hypothetical protein
MNTKVEFIDESGVASDLQPMEEAINGLPAGHEGSCGDRLHLPRCWWTGGAKSAVQFSNSLTSSSMYFTQSKKKKTATEKKVYRLAFLLDAISKQSS